MLLARLTHPPFVPACVRNIVTRAQRTPWMWFAACLVLPLLLSACALAAPTAEPVTIIFAHPNFDETYYRGLVEQYKKTNPHVTIELKPRRWDMLGGLSADGADVVVTSQFALEDLLAKNQIVSLDPLIAQDKTVDMADFYAGSVRLFVSNGKTWGLPAGLDPYVMYYNRDLFEQRRVALPVSGWTADEFLRTAAALRDPAANIYGYAVVTDMIDPLLFIYQRGGKLFDDLQNPTRTTFDDPRTIEAVAWYAKLLTEYNVAPTSDEVRRFFNNRIQIGIYRNQVGMWMGPLSNRGGQLEPQRWQIKWGMAALPRGAEYATMATAEGYFIMSQCKKLQECWRWVVFMSKQPGNGFVPPRKSVAASKAYEQQVGSELASIARASVTNAVLIRPTDLEKFAAVVDLFGKALKSVVDGQATAQEAMQRAQQSSPLK
ncbi:MAG: extracellular solute-binding protein [Chloroflexi bacterium]|nr:extracellular solute-binding protein [Chloroflexota bacterium]